MRYFACNSKVLRGLLMVNGMAAPLLLAASALGQGTTPGSGGPALETITVTAEYRSEKLQDTPLAITAFSGKNMEVRGLANVTDLDVYVPNAVIQPLGAGWGATYAAFIRGVGLGDNILSFEPGVPIYVDDVYNGRPQGSIFDLLDLERVEVLRGPQGTLFGKNAMGGAIRLISKKPTGDGSGYVEATYGSYQRVNLRGSYDTTIIPERLFARISASSKHADGYFKILNYECATGDDLGPVPPGGIDLGQFSGATVNGDCVVDTLGDEGIDSVRGALRFLASDAIEINIIGDFTRQRQKGPADKYTIIEDAPIHPALGLTQLWNDFVAEPTFGVRYDQRFLTNSNFTNYSTYTDPLTGRITTPNINDLDHWGVSGTIDWNLSETIHLKSVTAYRQWWNNFGRDSDGSPLPLDDTYDESHHRQLTQEVQLTGAFNILEWTVGGFYYHANDSNQGFNFLYPLFLVNQDSHDTQTTKNWAAFVHGILHVTDKLDVTAGIRYTDDEKHAFLQRIDYPSGNLAVDEPVDVSSTQWSPLGEVDYKFTPDLMVYALYSTGFRGGGFSPRPSNDLQVAAFQPDTLTNYELGFKSEWFENRLRLNVDTFFMRHAHQQNYKNDEAPAGVAWFHAVNAGVSHNWGFEAELQAEPVEGWHIDGSVGYLNYKLKDDQGSGLCQEFANGDPCYPTRAPEWNWAAGIQYTANLGDLGTVSPRVDVNYQSRIYFATFNGSPPKPNDGEGYQDDLTLVNGRITWSSPDDLWSVALFGNNLTNEEYFNGKLSLVFLLSREQGNIAPPRTWGITAKRVF